MKKVFLGAFLILISIPLLSQSSDLRGLRTVIGKLGGDTAVGRQYAVLIAIDKYEKWMALQNPVKDAKQIRDILAQKYYITDFLELYNEAATKAGIMKLFSKLIETAKPEDSIVIYFAGHGHVDTNSNTGFWIPVDGGTDPYEQANWLPNTQIRGFVGNMKARHIALIADSCFSGDILNPTRGASPVIADDYFRNAYARVSRQVLTSGASESVPDESQFSRQLKLALEGNTHPYLDLLMLYSQIRLGVSETTPLFGELKDSGHQEGSSFLFFYKESQASAQPVASPQRPTMKLTLEQTFGTIALETATAGVLSLDGELQGAVPAGARAKLENVVTGAHDLVMRYDDGNEETRAVVLNTGETASVEFSYKLAVSSTPPTNVGKVRIETRTSGALLLDGVAQKKVIPGAAITVGNLAMGTHVFQMKYDNGDLEAAYANIDSAEPISIKFTKWPATGLQDGDPLPKATIKINGDFRDWEGVGPAFASGTKSLQEKNLAIDKVYLAVDEENLYMRFDIKDTTASSVVHPNNFSTNNSTYSLILFNGGSQINALVTFSKDEKGWVARLEGHGEVIGPGAYAMKGSSLEASFPLDPVRKNIGLPDENGYYTIMAFTGHRDGWSWVDGDRTVRKHIAF